MKSTLFLRVILVVGCLVATIGVTPALAGFNPYPVQQLYNPEYDPDELKFQTGNFLPQKTTVFGGDSVPVTAFNPGTLSGLYEFTYLGYEAGYTNLLIDEQGRTQFNNKNTHIGTSFTYAIEDLFFQTEGGSLKGISHSITQWSNQVHIYQLQEEWTVADTHDYGPFWEEALQAYDGIVLPAGSFIFGFEDLLNPDDLTNREKYDFADMIIAATPNPVPIPAAVWLLGSGLLALVGVRRFRKG